jgi:DnaJ-class molecular chaperone
VEVQNDIANCRWCNGDGKDHGTVGMAMVRNCPRCEGSGRVYVTSRESATGRRRVYKAPAARFREGPMSAKQVQRLNAAMQKWEPKAPATKTRKKDARRHTA